MRHVGFLVLIFTVVATSAPQGQRRGGQNRPAAVFDEGPRVFDTTEYRIRVVNVSGGLSYPYCLAFLPDGTMLVAELEGRLRRIRDGALVPQPISGVPKVYYAAGQAGLMDIALHPNFAQNRFVYFTYNKPGEKGATMAVARGAFDGTQLTGVTDLFIADAWGTENGHLSARIAFGRDGMLYMTVADHNQPESAQKGSDHAGKILRLRDDGAAPADNPFAGRPGYRPEIFTIGNRNPHGIAIHPDTGEIWENEHGDEVNILKPGGNYGWPYVSIGAEGGGVPIAVPPKGLELMGPFIGWYPALNISGMAFYTGDKFPKWKGNLFVGGLSTQQVHRVVFTKTGPRLLESLFTQLGQRVRDVRQGPDGLLYFTTDEPAGHVMRIEPAL